MLHSGKLKSKVNCTYKKPLRTVYSKYKISLNKVFDEGVHLQFIKETSTV